MHRSHAQRWQPFALLMLGLVVLMVMLLSVTSVNQVAAEGQFGIHWTPVLHAGKLYLQVMHRNAQKLVALDAVDLQRGVLPARDDQTAASGGSTGIDPGAVEFANSRPNSQRAKFAGTHRCCSVSRV